MSLALSDFTTSLKHADRLIDGTKLGRGKPTAQEATMFVASVALTYAAWEAYVEDVAVEVTRFVSKMIDPSKVPESSRAAIDTASTTTWDLVVHPGWRQLWLERVETKAKGGGRSGSEYGMNTAGEKQIRALFDQVGLDFFAAVDHNDLATLERLIIDRGAVVHTASRPESFNKSQARTYRDLVARMAAAADESLRDQAEKLVGNTPW